MRSTAGRIIKSLHTLVDFVIISVIILLVFFAVFTSWETGRIYRDSDAEKLASYKPETENDLSFAELQKINPDVMAWLTVYGTPIDYPVVQAEDNNKYINRDIFGSFSLTGALFLDHYNSPDFRDFNNIIFGHHMDKEKMFGNLDEFRDENYFKKYNTGNLYASGRNYGIKAFAWLDVDAYDPNIYNTKIDAEEERSILLNLLKEKALVYVDGIADTNDRILLLSTCGTDTTNERYILAAVITDDTYKNPYPDDEDGSRSLTGKGSILDRYGCILILFLILLLIALIAYIIYRKMKRKNKRNKSITMSILLVLAITAGSFIAPACRAYAETDSPSVLKISQVVDTESDRVDEANRYTFTYSLSAESENANLPEGAEGNTWDFNLSGNNSLNLAFVIGNREAPPSDAALRFFNTGIYHYSLKQKDTGKLVNVTYDESVYDIYVKVVWEGGLKTEAVWVQRETGDKPDSITFINSVRKSKVIGDPPVRVVKRIEGNPPSKDDKFTFVMTPAQEDFPLPYGAVGEYETYLYGEGEIEIGNIEFDAPGIYEYRVWERGDPALSYTFDKTVFKVTYNIKEESDGSLSCERTIVMEESEETECVFTNIYNKTDVTPKGDTRKKTNPPADSKKHSDPNNETNKQTDTALRSRGSNTGDFNRLQLYTSLLIFALVILLANYLRIYIKRKHVR